MCRCESPTSARIPRSASTSFGIMSRSAVARSRGNSVNRLRPASRRDSITNAQEAWRHEPPLADTPVHLPC